VIYNKSQTIRRTGHPWEHEKNKERVTEKVELAVFKDRTYEYNYLYSYLYLLTAFIR
jgi:hypothetical protein